MSSSIACYTLDEIVDRFHVMQLLEETSYSYRNCLPADKKDTYLNIAWREKICQWSYNVVDHFDLSREVVAVSLNLFDRYMASRGNECSGTLVLLASLTTLHIACKLHKTESKKIKIETLASLSRGQFGPAHICEMEVDILEALGWHLHPPTQYAFLSHLLYFLPVETPSSLRKEIHEMSRYVTELAVCDTYFVDARNSTVAFASILNVMEGMSYARLSAGIRARFLRNVVEHLGMSYADPIVLAARDRLRAIMSTSNSNAAAASNNNNSNSRNAKTFSVATKEDVYPNTPTSTTSSKRIQDDCSSLMSVSVSSSALSAAATAGSAHQLPPPPPIVVVGGGGVGVGGGIHSRSNSFDSKGSFRYSPSPHYTSSYHHRRCFVTVASCSPGSSRAQVSGSPVVAGVQ